MLELPKPVGKQGALFPDLEDMPVIVHDLKEMGLAASDAWEIWQKRFDYVDVSKRPHGVEFETYIQEKLHLLKQRQAKGKVKSTTGFLLKAIKQNYTNPEFVTEETKRKIQGETITKHLNERKRQVLEDRKSELQTARDKELHQLCVEIAKETPALLEKVAVDVFKENPFLKKSCESGKPLLDTYQEKPMLRVIVDQYLMAHSPERFRAIRKRYESLLVALDPKMVAEEQASV
jgi:ribosomal protein L39E